MSTKSEFDKLISWYKNRITYLEKEVEKLIDEKLLLKKQLEEFKSYKNF